THCHAAAVRGRHQEDGGARLQLGAPAHVLEPAGAARGKFSQQYLDRVAQVVGWARDAGIYVILDMHQNAYSRYVGRSAQPPLPLGTAISLRYYTGAPRWATYTDGLPSESYAGQREVNPAVFEATTSFWY